MDYTNILGNQPFDVIYDFILDINEKDFASWAINDLKTSLRALSYIDFFCSVRDYIVTAVVYGAKRHVRHLGATELRNISELVFTPKDHIFKVI